MALLNEIENYWDQRSRGFSSAINEELSFRADEVTSELVELLDLKPGMKVLDLGCGPGLFSIVLARYGAVVTGVDYSAGMVEQARANAGNAGVDAKFLKMDAQDLEFLDDTFDAVVSRDMFWNLEDPARCYAEIVRVLKPGCKAFVKDGNYYLRLFDDNYKFKRPSHPVEDKGGHARHNTDNVDFKIIEDLARDLPLSRIERPQWDVNTLLGLGCSEIRTILPHGITNSSGVRVNLSFKIILTKEMK